jgi:hypothetical protein
MVRLKNLLIKLMEKGTRADAILYAKRLLVDKNTRLPVAGGRHVTLRHPCGAGPADDQARQYVDRSLAYFANDPPRTQWEEVSKFDPPILIDLP